MSVWKLMHPWWEDRHTQPLGNMVCQPPVQVNTHLSEDPAPPAPGASPTEEPAPPAQPRAATSPGRNIRTSGGLQRQNNTPDVMPSRRIQTQEGTHSTDAFPAFPAKPRVGREVSSASVWRDCSGERSPGGTGHTG